MTCLKNKKRKGMTLIELIAALAITPIVFGAIFQITLSMYKTMKTLSDVSDVQEKTKTVMIDITHSLKKCRKYINTKDAENDTYLQEALENAGGGKIVLYIEGYDNSRFMYIVRNNELYKYTFKDKVTLSHYTEAQLPGGGYAKYAIDKTEYDKKNCTDPKSPDYNYSDFINRIDSIKDHDGNNIYTLSGDLGLTFIEQPFIFYDNYENKYYLYGNEDGTNYYKFELVPVTDWDTELIVPGKKINYIKDLNVTSDPQNGNNCKVQIDAEKNGKKKSIKTDVYVPLGSEG